MIIVSFTFNILFFSFIISSSYLFFQKSKKFKSSSMLNFLFDELILLFNSFGFAIIYLFVVILLILKNSKSLFLKILLLELLLFI